MIDWRPIENAPRDGTPVLIGRPEPNFMGRPQVWIAAWQKRYSPLLRGDREAWWMTQDLPIESPSHWAPINGPA